MGEERKKDGERELFRPRVNRGKNSKPVSEARERLIELAKFVRATEPTIKRVEAWRDLRANANGGSGRPPACELILGAFYKLKESPLGGVSEEEREAWREAFVSIGAMLDSLCGLFPVVLTGESDTEPNSELGHREAEDLCLLEEIRQLGKAVTEAEHELEKVKRKIENSSSSVQSEESQKAIIAARKKVADAKQALDNADSWKLRPFILHRDPEVRERFQRLIELDQSLKGEAREKEPDLRLLDLITEMLWEQHVAEEREKSLAHDKEPMPSEPLRFGTVKSTRLQSDGSLETSETRYDAARSAPFRREALIRIGKLFVDPKHNFRAEIAQRLIWTARDSRKRLTDTQLLKELKELGLHATRQGCADWIEKFGKARRSYPL